MTVGGDDVEVDVREIVADAVEFGVAVYVDDGEATGGVKGHYSEELLANGRAGAVADRGNGPKMNVARNRVKEAKLLNKEKIHAKGHTLVCSKEIRRQRNALKTGGAGCGGSPGCFPFEGSDLGAVDLGSTDGVVNGERTVENKIGRE